MLSEKTEEYIREVFYYAGLECSALLSHEFDIEKFRYSREIDPIVGVSFTGLFDFFVMKFGKEWLDWWAEGRPHDERGQHFLNEEARYLSDWKEAARQGVTDYCDRIGTRVPSRYTTVQPAGCLDKDAVRVFDQGLLYADEVVAPGSGETKGIDLSVRGGISTRSAIANQPLNLVKVTLNNGRIIRMTPDHKLMIGGSWVQASDMEPGMLIEHSLGEYSKVEEPLLMSIDQSLYSREYLSEQRGHSRGVLTKTIMTPSTMNESLAYFLGALFGNGCISESKNRVRFSHERVDVLSRLSQISSSLFGIEGSILEDTRGGRYELCIASRQLCDWLYQNNIAKTLKSKDLDRIPEVIRRSSKYSILSFLAGLIDTDGSPRNKTFSIDLATEKFIRCVQQIGECLGLCFGVSNNTQGSNFQESKSMWTVHLYRTFSQSDAADYLNMISIKLQERPVELSTNVRSKHPFKIQQVELESDPDYSYDFAVDGIDYDDSWYWQGGLKSHNTKSLLTGASPGWHPPKGPRFIRRITFAKDDPVAKACIDYGYSVVPAQKDTDEEGNLLNDPFDPRCTEWLVEIPVEVSWANLDGCDSVNTDQFSVKAQFDFFMQVQNHYTTHNTSATLEYREHEIDDFAHLLHENISNFDGYMSAAMMARFDSNQTFPRLPFEPISKERYDQEMSDMLDRRKSDDFYFSLMQYDIKVEDFAGPSGCDGDKCLMPEKSPN